MDSITGTQAEDRPPEPCNHTSETPCVWGFLTRLVILPVLFSAPKPLMHCDSVSRSTWPAAGDTTEQAQGSLGPVQRGTCCFHRQAWPHLSAAPVPPASVPMVLQGSSGHGPAQVAPRPGRVPTPHCPSGFYLTFRIKLPNKEYGLYLVHTHVLFSPHGV